ncbi:MULTISPECIES: hypothetical protein [Pseudomonas]|uniref:Conjugal transfer protein n=1 Tax=Pseudomonas nitroreducens TaxID=46680 RepID=A0A6G6J872_PSENT|nr:MULTISPECIES: hypothetical protein [Pseudomonas]MDU4254095.1 hypothetical protein [Pseudomonas sp.]QIE91548.1 hypothetical protein G5B91_35035 [Pseudomonas nitroreducens]
MKLNKLTVFFIGCALSGSVTTALAVEDTTDTPWGRRMDDVTGLFGAKVSGSAVNKAGRGGSTSFDTFTPFQDKQQFIVGAYGSTQVGVGCDGLNLGTVLDGQMGQYGNMVEQFIQNAPSLAIMYLAYSQPTVKSVIDELNSVGQFGLDLSNLTCSGVRQRADKAYEENLQVVAEADCTVEEGYKSPKCMSGDGITSSLITRMKETKNKITSRATSLMSGVAGKSGGLVGVKSSGSNSSSGGASGSGSSSSAGGSGNGLASASVPSKNCVADPKDGKTPLVLAASELGCDDIKKYSGLLPNYSTEEDANTVMPRSISLEDESKKLTTEYQNLYSQVYQADPSTFENSPAYKELVNRGGIVVTDAEFKLMRKLGTTNPAMFAKAQQNLATLAMMKELDEVISKLEMGVMTGLANQVDDQAISTADQARYSNALTSLRKEYEMLQNKIKHDMERNKLIEQTAKAVING